MNHEQDELSRPQDTSGPTLLKYATIACVAGGLFFAVFFYIALMRDLPALREEIRKKEQEGRAVPVDALNNKNAPGDSKLKTDATRTTL